MSERIIYRLTRAISRLREIREYKLSNRHRAYERRTLLIEELHDLQFEIVHRWDIRKDFYNLTRGSHCEYVNYFEEMVNILAFRGFYLRRS